MKHFKTYGLLLLMVLAVQSKAQISANSDYYVLSTDTSIQAAVLINDVFYSSAHPSSLVVLSPPSSGLISVAGNTISYTPILNFTGLDSLTYQVFDDLGNHAVSNAYFAVHRPFSECVIGGDADRNGFTDNLDYTAVGLSYGYTFHAATAISTAADWIGAYRWNQFGRFADLNEDESVTADDTLLIAANYFSGEMPPNYSVAGSLPMDIRFDGDSFVSNSVSFHISMGDSSKLTESVAAMGFRLNASGQLFSNVLSSTIDESNWITNGSYGLSVYRLNEQNNSLDVAISRLDHQSSGAHGGDIGSVIIVIDDVLLGGIALSDSPRISFHISHAIAYNDQQQAIYLESTEKSITVSRAMSLETEQKEKAVFFLSNGSSIYFRSLNEPIEQIDLYSVNGQLIRHLEPKALSGAVAEQLSSGMYLLKVKTAGTELQAKVQLIE